MQVFNYIDNHLCIEDVRADDIIKEYGTPTYVYSAARIAHNFRSLNDALGKTLTDNEYTICYAVKANSNIAILSLLEQMGSGADIVSEGELFRCLKADIAPEKIVFSGVGKTHREIKYAIENKILQINAESIPELSRINEVAKSMGVKASVGLRINPDVEGGEYDKTSTARKDDKFGIDYDHALEAFRDARNMAHLDVNGISVHIGSQIVETTPFDQAYKKLAAMVDTLEADGFSLKTIDLGGGMGITYTNETPLDSIKYAEIVHNYFSKFNAKLVFEPGRAFTGDAGILLAQVQYVKKTPSGRIFVILDTGMGDLMRPAMYGSRHPVWPCQRFSAAERAITTYDVVGPICESSDIFNVQIEGPEYRPDDAVAIMVSGAYGMSMASNYNTRAQPLEVLVSENQYTAVSKRQSFDELIDGEKIPEWLATLS